MLPTKHASPEEAALLGCAVSEVERGGVMCEGFFEGVPSTDANNANDAAMREAWVENVLSVPSVAPTGPSSHPPIVGSTPPNSALLSIALVRAEGGAAEESAVLGSHVNASPLIELMPIIDAALLVPNVEVLVTASVSFTSTDSN